MFLVLADVGFAAPVQYTLDVTASTFTLTGTLDGVPLNEQTPGSRVVGYEGSLLADVDPVAKTLAFPTVVVHALSQSTAQQPSEPGVMANYGFTALGGADFTQLAVRGMGLYLQANALPFNTGSAPDAATLGFFVSDGELRYHQAGRSMDVFLDLHGLGAADKTVGAVTLVTNGNRETLTIPITSTFSPFVGDSGIPVHLNLTGQVVATRLVPEPASAGAMIACLGAARLRRRGRRRA